DGLGGGRGVREGDEGVDEVHPGGRAQAREDGLGHARIRCTRFEKATKKGVMILPRIPIDERAIRIRKPKGAIVWKNRMAGGPSSDARTPLPSSGGIGIRLKSPRLKFTMTNARAIAKRG